MKMKRYLLSIAAALALASTPILAGAANLTPQDYAEIQQLYAKYNHAIDSGNGAAWADTFTPDGVFRKTTVGHDALVKFVENFSKSSGGMFRHWNANLVVNGTAEGADGSVYLILWNMGAKPQAMVATGLYIDKLVKTSGGWRFKSRDIKADAPPPAPANP